VHQIYLQSLRVLFPAPTPPTSLPSPLCRKIELFELQNFLWAQLSSRLSDELFDQLTCNRRLCDSTDGTLDPDGFLELAKRVLARSRVVRRGSGSRTEKWAQAASFKLSDQLSRFGAKKETRIEEVTEEKDAHMQVWQR
jgi:hypothetical protein